MPARPAFRNTMPRYGSLSRRLSVAFHTIMILMVVPAAVSLVMMIGFSQLYYGFLSRAQRINDLTAIVVDQLPGELFNIVAGRGTFEEGPQREMMRTVNGTLDSLIGEGGASGPELTVARRTGNTLESYIDRLGLQMEQDAPVEDNFQVHEEIRNVSALMGDMFRDAVSTEIRAATQASRRMRVVLSVTMALEAALIAFAMLFVKSSQRSLSGAVAEPIRELQAFAGKIADGHLNERTPEPDVDELRQLSVSLNAMAGRLGELMEENRLEQESLKKSELRVLQAQVTPHFLYNTLDAIVWLAEAKKTEEVISITRALSDFYRISLSDGHDWITLAQEEEHLRGYLTIQKIRYRDILDYEIDIDPAIRNEMILKLSIQPLVENAIYHGIRNRRGGGRITVRVWEEEGRLRVLVKDNGAGMSAERLGELRRMMASHRGADYPGFGLFNVDQRIKLYYGQAQGLEIDSEQGRGSSISFNVPLLGPGQPPAAPREGEKTDV